MKKVLILDNYDSFTYNLVHYVEANPGYEVDVFRNDKISIKDVGNYDTIILSPGPGVPKDAGILKELILTYASSKKILGVCLGMQAIGEVYGGTLQNQERTYFGPVNINRMSVKLMNDRGEIVDLNGANWSFSFVCEQLYQQQKI